MRRLGIALAGAALAVCLGAAPVPGKVKGKLVVGSEKIELKHAYVVEKNALIRIVLADQPFDESELAAANGVERASKERGVNGVIVKLDEKRKAEEVEFLHPELGGIQVREVVQFKPSASNKEKLGGRAWMTDPGYSFSVDATFEAPISKVEETVEPLPADATPAQHALWRLKQLGIEYDENGFRNAVIDDNADVVKLFLDAGMNVESAGALKEAVERGASRAAKVLIEAGANVNLRDEYGQSLVMSSAGRPEMIKLLAAGGADVNVGNQWKMTPLIAAAEQGNLESVKALVAAGAKVNARNTTGLTALGIAALRGHTEIARFLLDSGADVKRDTADLLEYAKDHPEILAMIEAAAKKK